ncbi:MAG: energy-coupling factor transporter transmembrane protein EcfT [Firmicutes bacterium]|nr:energy-coupling factor transporter transmembrane protein EcfT [Bacillota bacterium]
MQHGVVSGAYIATGSWLHRMDPRAKWLAVLVWMVSVLLARPLWGYPVEAATLAVVLATTRLPLSALFRGLGAIWWLLGLSALLQLLYQHGGVVLVRLGPIVVTSVGVRLAVVYTLRVVLLVAGAALMTASTTPLALSRGLEGLMRPLRRWLPVADFAMMLSIALRFIPTLLEELQSLRFAQAARGARFDEGHLWHRMRALLPLLIPLLVLSLRRADEIALAMEARGYGAASERGALHPLQWRRADTLALAGAVGIGLSGLLPGPVLGAG